MGLSPSPAPPSRGLGLGPPLRTLLQTTMRTTVPPDSKAGLLPVPSPLLRRALGLMALGATCVQRLDGSRDSAIHTKYRISLCSSSMRESRYSLPRVVFVYRKAQVPPMHTVDGARGAGYRFEYSLARKGTGARAPGTGGGDRAESRSTSPVWTPQLLNTFAGSFCCAGFDNDPSAGSPMETLLRLLLPLNYKVQWTSRDVTGSEPPTSPRSKYFTGSFNR
ncbi:hypothetical protein CQW23_34831 [Capsicum baccatum]|uniref:Uncharacterized protein n=1 Tax=Capsicum baccatum TaxID=33114 RepID=A0A2G2UXW3_CAPBA|nr:hypothetical protein CQW23_34831 [Capsicum baccatum]